MLLISWISGAFAGVSQLKYDQLLRTATAIQDERNFYRAQISAFQENMNATKQTRQLTKQRLPAYQAPVAGEQSENGKSGANSGNEANDCHC